MSVVILILTGLSLINIIFELFFGALNKEFYNVAIPAGSPENIILIAQIVVLVVSVLISLPHIYIGIKGLKMAKNPDASRGHIVWGNILIVVTAIGLIAPIFALVQNTGDMIGNIAQLCSIVADVIILIEYVKCARVVRNGY